MRSVLLPLSYFFYVEIIDNVVLYYFYIVAGFVRGPKYLSTLKDCLKIYSLFNKLLPIVFCCNETWREENNIYAKIKCGKADDFLMNLFRQYEIILQGKVAVCHWWKVMVETKIRNNKRQWSAFWEWKGINNENFLGFFSHHRHFEASNWKINIVFKTSSETAFPYL